MDERKSTAILHEEASENIETVTLRVAVFLSPQTIYYEKTGNEQKYY